MPKFKDILKKDYSFSKNDNTINKKLMKPDDFIEVTYKEYLRRCENSNEFKLLNGKVPDKCNTPREYRKQILNPKNIKGIKEVIKKKIKRLPIPFLEFDHCGRPIGHEGRHTVVALKSLGYKKVPVTIVKRERVYQFERPCDKK